MSNSIIHSWMQIEAFKHGGDFHRLWSHGFVLEDNEDYIVIFSTRTRVLEFNLRRWRTKIPAVFILFKKQWFNVIATRKAGGIQYYVNLASPSIIDNNVIKFIDYDLDVKLFPDKALKLLDEKEYARHSNAYNYSDDIKEILDNTLKDIYRLIEKNDFPFNDELIKKYYNEFGKIFDLDMAPIEEEIYGINYKNK